MYNVRKLKVFGFFFQQSVISQKIFYEAFREWRKCKYEVEQLEKKDAMSCPACSKGLHACHIDGNRKLYRFKNMAMWVQKKPTFITYPTACKVPTRKIIKPEQTLTKPQVYFQDLHRASFFLNGPFGLYFQLGWISLVLHLVENPSKLYVPSFFLLKLSYTREVLIEMLECKIVQFCCNVIFNSNSF